MIYVLGFLAMVLSQAEAAINHCVVTQVTSNILNSIELA